MEAYRHEHFTREALVQDATFRGGPRPGEPFPDFELPCVDGGTLTRADLLGRPTLVTMGSITCPMTASATPVLKRLYDEYGDRVRFVTLYVREAHPGDRYPQPETMDWKIRHARDLVARDGLPWTVVVDDIEGTLHRALDAKANAAYLVDADGIVAFRSLWSNDERTLRRGLKILLGEKAAARGEKESRLVPMLAGIGAMHEVLQKAGPSAARDARRATPPLYGLVRLAGLFRPLSPVGRGAAATVVAGVGIALAMGAIIGGMRRAARPRRPPRPRGYPGPGVPIVPLPPPHIAADGVYEPSGRRTSRGGRW